MSLFTDFPFAAPIQKALVQEGYTKPTPIQVQTIPLAMAGRDILGIAQTGTGKTAAFALPILNRLGRTTKARNPQSVRALVLSPTRELASQICESFRTYGRDLGLKTDVVFGGVPIGKQQKTLLGGLDILVATPGRLIDLIDRRALKLNEIEVLVLDEADQMLDLGFIHALKRIVPLLPKQRQSMFFSATMPKTIASLADSFLDNPVKVAVTPVATTAERVTQGVMHVPTHAKQSLLHAVLRDPAIARVLVFTRTKHGANRVVEKLEAAKIPADAIHGNKSQGQRERALKAFRDGMSRVLVATDIAARGIDVEGVTHVINFELPNVPEAYVHRIGRTARAGASGIAISFCAPDEKGFLRDIERTTRVSVPIIALPEGVDFAAPPPREAGSRDERGPRQRQGQGRDGQSSNGARNGQSRNGGRNGQAQMRGPGGQAQDQRAAEPRAPRNPAEAARDPLRAEAAAGDKRRRNDFKPHNHGQRVDAKPSRPARKDGPDEARGNRNGNAPQRPNRNGGAAAQQGGRRERLWSNH